MENRRVLDATTEIVVAAVDCWKQYPNAEYAKDVADFATLIYKRLDDLDSGKEISL